MKTLSIIMGIVLVLLNLVICYLITSVEQNALILSTVVVFITFLFLYISQALPIKDGFKISLPFLFAFGGLAEYVLSFFVGKELKNNGYLIAILVLFVIQALILSTCYLYGKQKTMQNSSN